MSKSEILDSTPKELWVYDDAFKMTKREEEIRDYYLSVYMFEAVSIAVGNAFRGKGKKATEWRKYPIQEEIRESRGELTVEEKKARTNVLFANLRMMQANFERNK